MAWVVTGAAGVVVLCSGEVELPGATGVVVLCSGEFEVPGTGMGI